MILLKVERIGVDVNSHQAVVLLHEVEGERILPIWIGPLEANAIAVSLEGVKPARPLTHDLTLNMLEVAGGKVESVLVDDVHDGTFYAQITFSIGGGNREVDSRPSDAIALALRAGAPVYATDKVMASAAVAAVHGGEEEEGEGKKDDKEEGKGPGPGRSGPVV